MKSRKLIGVLSLVVVLSACAELVQIAQETVEGKGPLTQREIVAGLKEALVVGTDSAVEVLGVIDGYYRDKAVKILLPPEAEVIMENAGQIPGGQQLLDEVLLRINRAAEDAASQAGPVFINSIKEMTIPDALGILQGEQDAATQYLYRTTYDELFNLYQPKIEASIDKKLVGTLSTRQSWNALITKWNEVARSVVGQVAGFKPIDVKLEDYLTRKALDGLFLKIEKEEQQIRENPAARVTDLLKRVFGSVAAG